jgi:crotonobetainyl-CoA:carnitine CoA-transferase CaiB-like acyl-CoA transferase
MSGLPEPYLPAGWGYSYLDWLGAYSFGLAMLSALHHRNRTGQGQWIDASQCEAGIFASGTSIVDWSANGREWRRIGNRSPFKPAAPHGIFPCEGSDAWIAVACFDEHQWRSLCAVAGRPAWLGDPRFRTLPDRLSHQDELERAVGEWTAGQERYGLMSRLQQSGVPAGVCQDAADRCDRDPQLAHLGWLTEVTGTKIGTWPLAEVPVKMSATPATVAGTIGRGAPGYGEDNEYIYGELLGMSKAEISDLAAVDVI